MYYLDVIRNPLFYGIVLSVLSHLLLYYLNTQHLTRNVNASKTFHWIIASIINAGLYLLLVNKFDGMIKPLPTSIYLLISLGTLFAHYLGDLSTSIDDLFNQWNKSFTTIASIILSSVLLWLVWYNIIILG